MKLPTGLISLAIISLFSSPLSVVAAGRPNIVLLIADQHFADAMGCAGCDHVKTPALDGLAASGVRFRNTYCAYPVCMSSRASLMTGRWPHELGVVEGDEDDHQGTAGSSGKKSKSSGGKKTSLCEWARLRSGIKDKMINGSIALEPPLTECPPLPANFAIPADEPEVVGLRRLSQPMRAHPTMKWGEDEWRQYRWAYARLIEKMDEQVGRVLAALNTSGQSEQTVVVYTSDHGDGEASHHWNQKMVLYEEAVRIPLIVSWPGHTLPGKVDDTCLVSMGLDLLPTFCDYAGISVPPELTGRSLRAWADQSSNTPTNDQPRFVVTEVNYSNLLPGEKLVQGLLVRTSGFSYINYSAGKNREQFFDLRTDPGQLTNLVTHPDHQTTLAERRQLMREWVKQTKSPFPLDRIP